MCAWPFLFSVAHLAPVRDNALLTAIRIGRKDAMRASVGRAVAAMAIISEAVSEAGVIGTRGTNVVVIVTAAQEQPRDDATSDSDRGVENGGIANSNG